MIAGAIVDQFRGSLTAIVTPFSDKGLTNPLSGALWRGKSLKVRPASWWPLWSGRLHASPWKRRFGSSSWRGKRRPAFPVLASVGTNATAQSVEEAERAAAAGADGLVVKTPYYNKPGQQGLYQHFKAVA